MDIIPPLLASAGRDLDQSPSSRKRRHAGYVGHGHLEGGRGLSFPDSHQFMRRNLFIHAGIHRTATSTIQAFLRENYELLLAKGYFNPRGLGRNIGLANQIFAPSPDIAAISEDLIQRADSKNADIHSIVISDEDICMRKDMSSLGALQAYFDVTVLISMRRQDLWLESWHQQNVKWQWNPELSHLTLSEFLDRREQFHWIHYDQLLDNIIQFCGKDNLVLRIFEKREMKGGPVANFCVDIGLPTPDGLKPVQPLNSSVNPVCSEFLRLLPLDEMPPKYRALVENAAITLDSTMQAPAASSSRLLMDHSTRAMILAEYSEGNERVARDFMGREALFQEPIPNTDMPIAIQTLPSDSYMLMKEMVSPMLKNIIAELEKRDSMMLHKPRML